MKGFQKQIGFHCSVADLLRSNDRQFEYAGVVVTLANLRLKLDTQFRRNAHPCCSLFLRLG